MGNSGLRFPCCIWNLKRPLSRQKITNTYLSHYPNGKAYLKKLLILFILLVPLYIKAQTFIVTKSDTIPYKLRMEVRDSDTMYFGSCNTIVKKGDVFINRQIECVRNGYWEIEHEDSSISKGNYITGGKKDGVWKTYDKHGELIKEIEYGSVAYDTHIFKEIHYKNGQATIISQKTWFAVFYLKNLLLIALVLVVAFFTRVMLNSELHNQKNGTNYSPIYVYFGTFKSENFQHSLASTFTFWWNVNQFDSRNKRRAWLCNVLSVFVLGSFFILIIGLGLSGEL